MQIMRRKRAREEFEISKQQQAILFIDSSESDDEIDASKLDAPLQTEEDNNIDESVPERTRINVLSPGLVTALDRTKLSSRSVTYVLSEMASSLGQEQEQV